VENNEKRFKIIENEKKVENQENKQLLNFFFRTKKENIRNWLKKVRKTQIMMKEV
jgi:hypothetical protein